MKNKLIIFIGIVLLTIFVNINLTSKAADLKIVYFYSPSCGVCQETEPYIEELENQGIEIIRYDVTFKDNKQIFMSYNITYGVPEKERTTPMVFAGDKYFHDKENIVKSIEDHTLQDYASKDLLKVELIDMNVEKYKGFFGFFFVLFAGILDGFNPCAMAMLLLFISLLGFTSKKSTLIGVSSSYIFGLFITYFALGAFLVNFLHYFTEELKYLSLFINIFIISLSIFLFVFNTYDFIVSKNEKYGKIKNQLPKGIQKFNKKIIKIITNSLNNKNIVIVYLLTFSLGVIISLTEFLCTGQIYLPTILIIQNYDTLRGLLYLLLYNLAFIVPLVLITVISIKTQSVLNTSNRIREKLYLIKLLNGLLFLGIAIYYIIKLF